MMLYLYHLQMSLCIKLDRKGCPNVTLCRVCTLCFYALAIKFHRFDFKQMNDTELTYKVKIYV